MSADSSTPSSSTPSVAAAVRRTQIMGHPPVSVSVAAKAACRAHPTFPLRSQVEEQRHGEARDRSGPPGEPSAYLSGGARRDHRDPARGALPDGLAGEQGRAEGRGRPTCDRLHRRSPRRPLRGRRRPGTRVLPAGPPPYSRLLSVRRPRLPEGCVRSQATSISVSSKSWPWNRSGSLVASASA